MLKEFYKLKYNWTLNDMVKYLIQYNSIKDFLHLSKKYLFTYFICLFVYTKTFLKRF